jgi:hypothetical protein
MVRQGLLTVLASFLPGEEHFSFQKRWIADRLVLRDTNRKVYKGGLLSNTTYCFFKNGFLLTTSMYSEELGRWIPVLLTCLCGLSKENYETQFRTLFKQFWVDSITEEEQDTLCRQVVDYSATQRKGFIKAYLEVFNKSDPEQASQLCKGCHEHFWVQVTRVKGNCSMVMAHEDVLTPSFNSD